MNDLAEMALDGLLAARRAVVSRPTAVLAAAGFVITSAIVVTASRVGAAPAAVPVDRWLHLLPEAGYRITGVAMGVVLLAAIGALLAVWLTTILVCHRAGLSRRQVWTIAATWALPFVVGPPLFSTDIFGYVARGLLSGDGRSPYDFAPSALGQLRVVDAIDPTWRGARSSEGPLGTLLGHLVVSVCGGTTVPALLVFRAIGVLSVIAIGRLAAELAGPRAPAALCLTVLNPAVLLFVVAAGQVVGLLGALLLGALVAAQRRRWLAAVGLAALAAALKPVALIAVLVVIIYHALGYRGRRAWRLIAGDCAAALVPLAVLTLAVPRGLGWPANLGDAFHDAIPSTPSSLLATVIGWVVPAAYDDLQTGARIAAASAAVIVIGYLFLTMRTRSLERTLGYALLAAAILAPVLYPQFLLWGVLCLAPTALGTQRAWVVALSSAACVLNPVGLGDRGGEIAAAIAVGAIAAALAAYFARLRTRRPSARAGHDPGPTPGDRRHVARPWPFRTSHRRDLDPSQDDLEHRLRLHHGERGA